MRSRLRVEDVRVEEAVNFYTAVFGAEVERSFSEQEPPRRTPVELKIGSKLFSVYSGNENPYVGELVLYDLNPRAIVDKASAASDQCQITDRIVNGWNCFYIRDPFGYTWDIRDDRFSIPSDLIETMLRVSPVRALLKLQLVSKGWQSMIFQPKFLREYRGKDMLLLCLVGARNLVIPLNSLLMETPMSEAMNFPLFPDRSFPFPDATCGTLWCHENEDSSLLLYNPATLERRQLPLPISIRKEKKYQHNSSKYVYGVAHVDDDVKVLKLDKCQLMIGGLYSLQSDVWKVLFEGDDYRQGSVIDLSTFEGVYSNEKIHWIMRFTSDL